MTKHQEEIAAYIVGNFAGLLILIGLFAFAYLKAKYIYGGDMRCLIAECRITK